MKILSVEQIRDLDKYTIEHEPIPSIDLMERASQAFVDWFTTCFDTDKRVLICAGTGNNGGDALAIARMLTGQDYQVSVVIIGDPTNGSEDFQTNLDRLGIENSTYTSCFPPCDVIIDGIFGSGLSRPAEGEYGKLIDEINQHQAQVVAIDMPSGLFADKPSDGSHIIEADYTISFQLPKLAFMMPKNQQYVGEWHVVHIGLSEEFIQKADTDHHYINQDTASGLLKRVNKTDHKGTNGKALLVSGSLGKMGAAILASQAALRTGVGLLSVHVPKVGNDVLQLAAPEAMTIPDEYLDYIGVAQDSERYDAVGIGPGIGKDKMTVEALRMYLENCASPLVLDADALNILSEHREMMELLRSNTILTPHPKEFERLLGHGWDDDFERLNLQKEFSRRYHVIIILKGPHTSIAAPDGKVYFNSTGNPGMAKGGSGDVLTGMVTSLLAQQYKPAEAAIVELRGK